MAAGSLTTLVHHLRRLAGPHEAATSDGDLLGRFVRDREEAAFAELVYRHGPMVLGVCRRVLGHAQDAEDAFQATFLVLVKRAAAVRPAGRVGNWLYGVAYRTALEARGAASRRRAQEAKVEMMLPQPPEDDRAELRALLDEELSRLPDVYRAPLVLCDLEGMTRKEAARQLGWPEGTVASRLARGRDLLARRLSARGAAGAVLAALAPAAVPGALSNATIKAATLVAAGTAATAGLVPAPVAALVEGVSKMMLLTKLKVTTALIAGLVIAVAGFGGFVRQSAALGEPPTRATAGAGGDDAKPADKKADEESINAIWVTEPRVQKELRLTEAQIKKVNAIRSEVYGKHEAALKKTREEAKKGNFAASRELSKKIQAEERAALSDQVPKILSAGAVERLRQIQRQARGLHNLVRQPAVRKKLALDDEQTRKIEAFLKEGSEAARKEAAKRATGLILAPMTIEAHVASEQKIYADAMKGVLGVFTKEQKRNWNELAGEPFEFKASETK